MGENSKIEWTDATWSPIRARNKQTGKLGWHCEHVTTGCEFCYAGGFNKRLGTRLAFKPGHRKDVDIFLDETMLLAPLRWKKPRMIFVCSMTDLFADFVADEWIDKMFAVMALCPQHTFQVLTKRPARMREYCTALRHGKRSIISMARKLSRSITGSVAARSSLIEDNPVHIRPLPNVWLGVSAERQQEADERIPLLLQTPAAVRFVSAEPLLGPLDLSDYLVWTARTNHPWYLNWVIVGGESGPGARPMHPQWASDIRDQCAAADVAFFFKQWGEWLPGHHYTNELKTFDSCQEQSRFDCMDWDGDRAFETEGLAGWDDLDDDAMWRVGKKRAGRLLDGREHNGMPALGQREGV